MKNSLMFVGLLVLSLGLVFAAQPVPHAFEGQISVEDGSLTSGKTLTASLNGIVTAKTTIEGNLYKITVIDNTRLGGDIEFFIGSGEADETFSFRAFEITKTDLNFETIDEIVGDCGDGICDSNVNECSFCAVDCPVSSCLNNGVCDEAIGEDYVTAPNDCSLCGNGIINVGETCDSCPVDVGVCVVDDDNDGGSSGGSGGSSGGSGTSSVQTQDESVNSSNANSSDSFGIGIDELNQLDNETLETTGKSFFSSITGAVVGGGSSRSIIAIIFVVLAVVGFWFIGRKKKEKKSKKSKK